MRFDQPVLLYGAGREARSTKAFLKFKAPGTKIYVTVDSGDIDIEDAEIVAPADLKAAIDARHFATIVKSPGVSRYRPIFAVAREAGIAVTSNLNLWAENLSRQMHGHRHHRHQGQIHHGNAGAFDADAIRAGCRLGGQCRVGPA